MKTKVLRRLATFLSAAVLIVGCASRATAPTSMDNFHVVKEHSQKGEIDRVQVFEENGATIVQGAVIRRTSSSILNGHVHVDLVDQRGVRVDTAVASYRLPKYGRRVARSAVFYAQLSTRVYPDSMVVVRHHDAHFTGHPMDGTLQIR